jgi:hypothetical protein
MKKVLFLLILSLQISKIFAGDSIVKFVFRDKTNKPIKDSMLVQINNDGGELINMRDTFYFKCIGLKESNNIAFTPLNIFKDTLYDTVFLKLTDCNTNVQIVIMPLARDENKKRNHKKRY